jgi:hypothetical protein
MGFTMKGLQDTVGKALVHLMRERPKDNPPKIVPYRVIVDRVRQEGVVNAPVGWAAAIDRAARSMLPEGSKVIVTYESTNYLVKTKIKGKIDIVKLAE